MADEKEFRNTADSSKSYEELVNDAIIDSPSQHDTTNIEQSRKEESIPNDGIKTISKKGISITRALVLFGYESWTALEPLQERGRQGYVEKKLKTDLERELAYIEERDKLEQETKEYFGEKMYATLKEIKESRERALVVDSETSDTSGPGTPVISKRNSTNSILTLDQLSLDNVYLRYLRTKAHQSEELAKHGVTESKSAKSSIKKNSSKQHRRGSLRKPRQKDFLQDNIASITSRTGSTKRLSKERQSSDSLSPQASVAVTMRRASIQTLAVGRFESNKFRNDSFSEAFPKSRRGSVNPSLLEDKASKNKSGNDSGITTPSESNSNVPGSPIEKSVVKSKNRTGADLLMDLMKKNVGEVELSSEQRALHEAYHTLVDEYQRRKKLREKTGAVFKRARTKIKEMLKTKNAWSGNMANGKELISMQKTKKESDLELKSRSQFLQKRKAASRKIDHTVVAYNDADRI